MNKLLSTAGLVLFVGSGAFAHARHPHPKAHAKPAPKVVLVCPVTGEKIASAAKAAGHMTYKGKTYYFCCGMCKPKFVKNPQHFIDNSKHGKYEKM